MTKLSRLSATLTLAIIPAGLACRSNSAAEGRHGQDIPRVERLMLSPTFRGPVIVIYDQAEGVRPERRGDTAVYRVPHSGILRTALPTPAPSTRFFAIFMNQPSAPLQYYPNCESLWILGDESRAHVCSVGYQILGTGIPYHIVTVVSERARIAEHYNRAGRLLDSLGFARWTPSMLWKEPANPNDPAARGRRTE